MLDPRVAAELQELRERLETHDRLVPAEQYRQYSSAFRTNFGPDALARLDGEALLVRMHGGPDDNSLVWWLEYKNDDEFSTAMWGGIAGGSALKFGIYRRKETGAWMTGSPQAQKQLSVEEGIEHARRHRQQLTAAAAALSALPEQASDEQYAALQKQLESEAADLCDSSWMHKYLQILFPDKLDAYHNPDWQRFHLIKLLQEPPTGGKYPGGRYLSAGRYVAVANELNLFMNHLTFLLGERNGPPHAYWRIGTTDGTTDESRWEMMRAGNLVAIGWEKLRDLSEYRYDQPSKTAIKGLMDAEYPNSPANVRTRKATEVFRFATEISEHDTVVACRGQKVLGIGTVVGPYVFDITTDFAHQHSVHWEFVGEWELEQAEGVQTSCSRLWSPTNLVAIEGRLLDAPTPSKIDVEPIGPLEGIPGRIQQVVERKGQVILYGPPGTGKTYWAQRTARELAARAAFKRTFQQLDDSQKSAVTGQNETGGLVRFCCFHPAYGYEDFLEGYRPETEGDQLVFKPSNGIFKQMCVDALQQKDRNFYLIVDEINRGDIPRIFGELLTIIERDKRGRPISLPLGGAFQVPANVYLIGTMNTADRSIALLDTALRRRFGFIELMPDPGLLGSASAGRIPLGPWLEALNQRIRENVGRDARNLQVGHSYFMPEGKPITDFPTFARMLREDVFPLLQEYCYEDYSVLRKILGEHLVDDQKLAVREDLWEPAKQLELIEALGQFCPEIFTSSEAVASDAKVTEEEEALGSEEEDEAAGDAA